MFLLRFLKMFEYVLQKLLSPAIPDFVIFEERIPGVFLSGGTLFLQTPVRRALAGRPWPRPAQARTARSSRGPRLSSHAL